MENKKTGMIFLVDADIQIVKDFEAGFEHQANADIQIVQDFGGRFIDADIQFVEEFLPLGVENNNQEFENVVEERQPSDPNDNPKYSEAIKKKLELIKKDKRDYYEATKDWNQDLLKEGKEVQLKYQEFNLKVYKGCFCQYNPFKLKEFAEGFTKFRKELKSTQEDVRLDLGKYMKKPLTTLTISKFENLNLTGTKMVGIKKLLEFWMKVKNVEKNRDSVLRARQVKMLEDRAVMEQARRNIDDVDMWPTMESMVEQIGVDIEETAQIEVMTMETDPLEPEPAAIRFNYEDGKLTRVFDCAEVQEKIVMNLGVREKLAQLQTIENIRKEEERRIKKRYSSKNGKNMVVQNKRGRPVKNFNFNLKRRSGKNSNLKRLAMGLKSGEHGKMLKTDGKGQNKTANARENNQGRKRGRAKNPVEMEETANTKRWRQKEPVGSAPPLFKRSTMSKGMEVSYNKYKENEQNDVDYHFNDMEENTNPLVASEKLVDSIQEDKIKPFQDMSRDFLDAMALFTTKESFVELDKFNQILLQEENQSEIIEELDLTIVTTDNFLQHQTRDDFQHIEIEMAPNHHHKKPLNNCGDPQPLHVLHDGDSPEFSLLPNKTSDDFQQLIPISDIQLTKAFEDSAASNPLNSSGDN